jgi:hypothetical protein
MKRLALLITFAGLSGAVAHADVVTLEEHSSGDTPVFELNNILNAWGTPGASNGTSDTMFYTSGANDVGTNDLVGLNIVNNTGITITSLQVYVYGTIEGGTFDYNCGVNNFFTNCTPGTGVTLPSGTVIPIGSPVEWDYTGLGGSNTGIANGTEFRLTDSVDGLSGTSTALFYEIEINGNPSDPPAPTPEPATIRFLAGGVILMGLALRRKLTRAS